MNFRDFEKMGDYVRIQICIWSLPLRTYAPRGSQVSFTFILRITCKQVRTGRPLFRITGSVCYDNSNFHLVCIDPIYRLKPLC